MSIDWLQLSTAVWLFGMMAWGLMHAIRNRRPSRDWTFWASLWLGLYGLQKFLGAPG